MRLIDADALKENCDIKLGNDTIGRRQYVMFHEIDDAPTIDAVVVVRCKVCRWYEPKYKDKEYDCPQGLYAVYADDYCSHGERREP